jgi:hypothetical protein
MSRSGSTPASKKPSSYYTKQVQWVATNLPNIELQAIKPLLTCFLTINEFRKFLFDPKVNFAKDINDEFIKDIMLVDFGHVILDLTEYRGPDRDKAWSTYQVMKVAQEKLYNAYNAFIKKNDYQKENAKVAALIACRDKLFEAYLLLEYLDRKIKKYYKP